MQIEVHGAPVAHSESILTPSALAFLSELEYRFGPTRRALLAARAERQARLAAGERPDFLPETAHIRAADWQVAPIPQDLQDRRVEITGPTDAKMLINALNSGARCFMADFEDSNTPSWSNIINGQVNLTAAVRRSLAFTSPEGKHYALKQQTAVLIVRPRGLHLDEANLTLDGQPLTGSFVDFGLYLFHNAEELLARGSGPYFYLPKLESHLEARLWNDLFTWSEKRLGLVQGTIKATVLIETILAAFEMDEILYELREHAAGLNAGRWDYIFSVIKQFRHDPAFLLPDRSMVSMTVPFMRAYTQLLVKTCHRRGAHAMGGMAAFIPSRKDEHVNRVAIAKVTQDKEREAGDGFDGTWVAHPDLVPVAMAVFDHHLGTRPNQVERQRNDVHVTADELLHTRIHHGRITEAGLRGNIGVALQYLATWLGGSGAVAIHNLMEDVATAEISRSQVWQWIRHGARLFKDGPQITPNLVRLLTDEEAHKLAGILPADRLAQAIDLFLGMTLSAEFIDFLTLPAYQVLLETADESDEEATA
ncbi:MAG TPA: malate synthase A [Symbiobacteriaceae bacterium]|nr:malate synthase A [Symbiobacteriaceae bacterium]